MIQPETAFVTLTDTAVEQFKLLFERRGTESAVRVFITPGGCSGFSYGMAFEESPAEDDQIVEYRGIKVVVDEFSAHYLEGAEIDYVNNLMGGGFSIHNPNAVSSCGCGQSFQAQGGGGAPRSCH